MKQLTLLLITALAFTACDKVSNKEVYTQAAPEPTKKKALLEVFTGWRCVNCPEKTEIGLNNIKSAGYEDNVVIMKIHSGFFAIPEEDLTMDFNTAEGDVLFEQLQITSNPVAVASRTRFNGSFPLSPNAWVNGIANILTKDTAYAPLELDVSLEYSDVTRKLAVKAIATLTRSIDREIEIIAYITEDSVVNPQHLPKTDQFPDGIDYNFLHRHILRTKLQAKTNTILLTKGKQNDKFEKNFNTFSLPLLWKDYHCAVVVVALNKSDGKVIQVQELNMIE